MSTHRGRRFRNSLVAEFLMFCYRIFLLLARSIVHSSGNACLCFPTPLCGYSAVFMPDFGSWRKAAPTSRWEKRALSALPGEGPVLATPSPAWGQEVWDWTQGGCCCDVLKNCPSPLGVEESLPLFQRMHAVISMKHGSSSHVQTALHRPVQIAEPGHVSDPLKL